MINKNNSYLFSYTDTQALTCMEFQTIMELWMGVTIQVSASRQLPKRGTNLMTMRFMNCRERVSDHLPHIFYFMKQVI